MLCAYTAAPSEQVQQMEAQRQLEKRRFEQQQRAKLGQVARCCPAALPSPFRVTHTLLQHTNAHAQPYTLGGPA